jgi:hypothetical protein
MALNERWRNSNCACAFRLKIRMKPAVQIMSHTRIEGKVSPVRLMR